VGAYRRVGVDGRRGVPGRGKIQGGADFKLLAGQADPRLAEMKRKSETHYLPTLLVSKPSRFTLRGRRRGNAILAVRAELSLELCYWSKAVTVWAMALLFAKPIIASMP
jgi:hypothetical protein